MTNSKPLDEREGQTADLAERLSEVQGVSEDTAEFIANNWRKLLVLLAVCMLGVVGVRYWKLGQISKNDTVSNYFSTAQDAFSELVSTSTEQEKKDKARVLLEEQFKAIKDSADSSVYGKLEGLYQARLAYEQNDLPKAKSLLETYQLSPSAVNKEASDSDVLIDEMAALSYARVLLKEGGLAAAQSKLSELASAARFVNVEAIVLYARLAESEADKTAVSDLAKKASADHQEFSSVITQELKNLGYQIEE